MLSWSSSCWTAPCQANRRTRFINGAVKTAAVLVSLALGTPCGVDGQELEIGIIDVYGLSRVGTWRSRRRHRRREKRPVKGRT